MPYKVDLTTRAQKELDALPAQVRERVQKRVDALADNPRQGAQKLEGAGDRYRVRVGDYRIIFEIDDAAHHVLVVRIADRKDAYK